MVLAHRGHSVNVNSYYLGWKDVLQILKIKVSHMVVSIFHNTFIFYPNLVRTESLKEEDPRLSCRLLASAVCRVLGWTLFILSSPQSADAVLTSFAEEKARQ